MLQNRAESSRGVVFVCALWHGFAQDPDCKAGGGSEYGCAYEEDAFILDTPEELVC